MLNFDVVDVRKISSNGALKAFADVVFGGVLYVKGFSVLQGKNGLIVCSPRKVGKDGRLLEVVTLNDDVMREKLEKTIIEAYQSEG